LIARNFLFLLHFFRNRLYATISFAAALFPHLGKVCIGTVQGDLHDIGKNLVKLREKYGKRIYIKGGLDKHTLRQDKAAILAELEYKMSEPMLKGGTIFALDYRIPNGVSLENYRYYVNKDREILDLEPISGEGWERMAF